MPALHRYQAAPSTVPMLRVFSFLIDSPTSPSQSTSFNDKIVAGNYPDHKIAVLAFQQMLL
jgi:hypothetical protein